MKQKIVILVGMSCERSRSKAMTLAARTAGVISMGITGDGRDRLEVVGVGVDSVCLVYCLRKKVGHAQIIQVEEVKDKKPDPPKPPQLPPPPYVPCYHPHPHYPQIPCCHPHPHYPQMVVCCDEPSSN